MKKHLSASLFVACTVLLSSCATTTAIKETWKSQSYSGGPVGTVAVLAVTERGLIRVGLENRIADDIGDSGNTAIATYELLSLPDIQEDQDKAAEVLKAQGAECVLITRLIAATRQAHSTRAGPEIYDPVITGFSPGYPYYGYAWGGYYTVAFQNMNTVWGSDSKIIHLETSLFRLEDGEPLWSCVTKTVLTETSDSLAEMDRLAAEVVAALQRDGLLK